MENEIPYKLPGEWAWRRLGEIFIITSGGTPDRGNITYYNGDIPWVKSGELNNNIITTTEELITNKAIRYSSAKIFPVGTILIALYGATVGKLAILGMPAATNQAVAGIIASSPINKYIFYYLLSIRKQLLEQRQGAAQPNISQKILKDLFIPIPPYEQLQSIINKIEEVFSEVEKNEELLQKSLTQLKIYKKAILQYAFEGKLTEKWREKRSKLREDNSILSELNYYWEDFYRSKTDKYNKGNTEGI